VRIQEELAGAKEKIKELEEKIEGFIQREKQYNSILNNVKEINEKLSHLATHDSLTHILNRYSLKNYLEKAINMAKNEKICSALLLIDLDNFKVINDTYGHSVGDEVLIKISNEVSELLLKEHIIGRFGGDEFAVLLTKSTLDEGVQIAERIRTWLEKNELDLPSGININITTSIGVVKIDGSLTCQKILSYADTALYSAKNNGKNRLEIIETIEDKIKLSKVNDTVNLIKRAIKENLFVLHYQPITKTNNEMAHYEALIRMVSEDGHIIYPNEFIPIAEKYGLMSQIDRWVVTKALETLGKHENIHIFINLSALSLGDKALLAFIEDSIKNKNIDSSRLGFEITETTAIRDLLQSEEWIRRIKLLGCKFALDDFGVGFSSFSQLSNLPVDYLKIDGSFVKNIDKDPRQRALIEAMNGVAHALGKKTIAEFVENEAILNILQDLNVDCFQGYHIGKPQLLHRNE
jgi:diguanylate cyclase (GGDEF)-like protein